MEKSPNGNEISTIFGDGETIRQRGAAMESLGVQMIESANILQLIGNGTEGKGFSVKTIRENVGDLHVDLREAGSRYEPSGRVMRDYGEALVSVQPTLTAIVNSCTELWAAYESSVSNLADVKGQWVPADQTPAQAEARASALTDLGNARTNAYQAWKDEAERYDAPYDTWDAAYDKALAGLQDANDNGVSDSFWDNALPFVEAALIVLAVAGIVLAVLALVIGGPLIALLAAIVGIVALGLTIWKVAAGRGGASDIGWAIVGVIPFGRLGQLGSAFKSWGGAGAFAKGFGADLIGLTPRLELQNLRGLSALVRNTPVVNSAGNLTEPSIVARMYRFGDDLGNLAYSTPGGWSRIASRIAGGTSGQLADSIAAQFLRRSSGYTNRMDDILSGSWLSGMQIPRSGLDAGLNIVDTLAKPAQGAWVFGQELADLFVGSPVPTWDAELARNP